MSPLVLILMFLLRFKDVRGHFTLYHRPGGDVFLPCEVSLKVKCSVINWLYTRDPSRTIFVAENGNVSRNSARLSLTRNCFLTISNITAEDAGLYTCRPGKSTNHNTLVNLNILTISPSPPDADPNSGRTVTLECSLSKFKGFPYCQPNSIRWLDESGAELDGEVVEYKLSGQKNCGSRLTVKRQSGHNRRYTCQYFEGDSVKIEAHYTPVFSESSDSTESTDVTDSTESTESSDSTESTPWSPLAYVMLCLRITTLILMIGITVIVIRDKGRKKPLEHSNVPNVGANPEDRPK
ncbi:cytotoxic and regulatory T-cell molecule-like isoform X2 [Mugil cephalus]|uniref:cytotoxic and regulatory T-cell molecule-like isoform X2 n=1 Tax=Mugil cephalus TaxID=48193 RepID=UPI001FB6499F|nr:cytotoxic and regulatory T-cell molecule-like isoform X2 [Mugil cephalus]